MIKRMSTVTLVLVILIAIIVAVLLFKPQPTQFAAGTTYYVSLTGSNSNDGSVNRPYRNINYAVERLRAGDSLCIGNGIYINGNDVIDEQYYPMSTGNSYSEAITIGGCNGEIPTIKPPAWFNSIRLVTNAKHHFIFHDMRLDGSLQPGNDAFVPDTIYLSGGSHHIRMQRLIIEHTMTNGAHWSATNSSPEFQTHYEMLDSIIQDIGNSTGSTGNGAPGINKGYGIYTWTAGNLIYGNVFTETRGHGLVVYGPDNVVDSNRFYRTGTRGGPAPAINIGSTSHPIPSSNNLLINNLVYNNVVGGLQIYSNSSIFAYNNTFYNNPFSLHTQYCVAATLQNNIFRKDTTELINDSPSTCKLTMDHNLSTDKDPLFVNPDQGDFRLLSIDSPAYNKGLIVDKVTHDFTGVITRPQALIADIGAYEIVKEDGTTIISLEGNSKLVLLGSEVSTITSKLALVKSLICHNPNAERSYVQLFNLMGVTKTGETEPLQSYGIPPNQTLSLTGLALSIPNQLGAAATTTLTGTIAPSSKVSCNFEMTVSN
jgi:hypothetical protein